MNTSRDCSISLFLGEGKISVSDKIPKISNNEKKIISLKLKYT